MGKNMARKKKPNLPPTGTAFAFALGDGRFCTCRVLLDTMSERSKAYGAEVILVACSRWIGNRVPRADDPALRPILYLNHHSWKNDPNALWIPDAPPPDMIPIGTIQPTQEEQAIACKSFGGWKALTLQPLAQWNWDNQRDAAFAADAIEEKKGAEVRLEEQRKREQYLERITLEELRGHRFFRNWKDYPPPKAICASRMVMANTVEELLELGPRASEHTRMEVLKRCIESFNELDEEMHFIETIEREDICEEFDAIVHACKLGAHEDLADRWRDW